MKRLSFTLATLLFVLLKPGMTIAESTNPQPPIIINSQVLPVTDAFSCSVEFFGSATRSSALDVGGTLGATRFADPSSKVAMTWGSAYLGVSMHEQNTFLYVSVSYRHAVKKDAKGKVVKAVQQTCIDAGASKADSQMSGAIITNCNMLGGPTDPFDPNDPDSINWQEVPMVGDYPALVLNKTQYFDVRNPNGADSGVIKVICQNGANGTSSATPINPMPHP